jgi:hypothetical protein
VVRIELECIGQQLAGLVREHTVAGSGECIGEVGQYAGIVAATQAHDIAIGR